MSQWFRSYGFADVADRLLIGAYPLDEQDVTALSRLHVSRVLNLTEDAEYPDGAREAAAVALDRAGIVEERLPMPDYGGLPASVIDRVVDMVSDWLDEDQRVYLHCRAGWQRSAALAAAVLADRTDTSLEGAMAQVKARKSTAEPLPHQVEDLEHWWRRRQAQALG